MRSQSGLSPALPISQVWQLRKKSNFCVELHFVFTAAYLGKHHSMKFAAPFDPAGALRGNLNFLLCRLNVDFLKVRQV